MAAEAVSTPGSQLFDSSQPLLGMQFERKDIQRRDLLKMSLQAGARLGCLPTSGSFESNSHEFRVYTAPPP